MNKMCRTNAQGGRSMIEMLGVLAIIGVLSVGGIAGYSKAMTKYRINKTIDQITQISQNVRMLYGKQRQKNYRNLSERILYKANLAPKEMFTVDSTIYKMNDAWGHSIQIDPIEKNEYFVIFLYSLPTEACIELATHDWGSRDTTGINAVTVFDLAYVSPNFTLGTGNCSGQQNEEQAIACSEGSNVSMPMPVDAAVDPCSGPNVIGWVFQ